MAYTQDEKLKHDVMSICLELSEFPGDEDQIEIDLEAYQSYQKPDLGRDPLLQELLEQGLVSDSYQINTDGTVLLTLSAHGWQFVQSVLDQTSLTKKDVVPTDPSFESLRDSSTDAIRRLLFDTFVVHDITWVILKDAHWLHWQEERFSERDKVEKWAYVYKTFVENKRVSWWRFEFVMSILKLKINHLQAITTRKRHNCRISNASYAEIMQVIDERKNSLDYDHDASVDIQLNLSKNREGIENV